MIQIHANTEQLLEFKDGIKNEVSSHIESCDICLGEITALRAIQKDIFAIAEQTPSAAVWDSIVNAAEKPQVQRLFDDDEVFLPHEDVGRSKHQVPVDLLVAEPSRLSNYNSLSTAIYSLAASILVTGFIGFYIFGQQDSQQQLNGLLSANVQELVHNSKVLERTLQQVSLQNELLTVGEKSTAERLYWRLTYVDQLINESSVDDSSDPEQVEQLWKSRIGALQELNQLYYQRQKTLDDSVI